MANNGNIDTDDSQKKSGSTDINTDKNVKDKNIYKHGPHKSNTFLFVCVLIVLLGVLLEVMKAQYRNRSPCTDEGELKPASKYCVYSAYSDVENKNGLLKHVHLVLERIGFEKGSNTTPWNLLWSHDYPFRALYPNLHNLNPTQKVNHFPGTGFITNKVDLATSNLKYIPKAFKLPQNKKEFLEYASKNKNLLFLEKHNQHRGVYLKNVTEIDLSSGESFVQEYVQKPFLVDGHKFDIGVYVVLTSVDPLRVYWYKGDVLFRYCLAKYYPFDPKDLDKYVVGDDYLPTWEVPSLAHPYTALGFGMRDAFDIYVRSKGKDPSKIWDEVQKAIAEVFINKEKHVIEALKNYPSQDNFFELMRFDLVLDEELNVYLLEANMSPNLSSAHYPPNQLLYEQVLYNLFTLTGVADHTKGYNKSSRILAKTLILSMRVKPQKTAILDFIVDSDISILREQTSADSMVSSQKNIAVWGSECSSLCKERCDPSAPVCGLCRPCIKAKLRDSLLRAHKEYLHRGDFRRLIPPPMEPNSLDEKALKNLTEINKLQYLWYQGKCNIDITWCA